MRRTVLIVASVLLVATHLAGQNAGEQTHDGNIRLTLKVLNGDDQQPIPDAHVVVRFTEERMLRRDKRVAWQAKTNRRGILVLSDIPTGTVQVQIIAKGFQTYGDEHVLAKQEEELTIQLHPPQDQVSAY